MILEWAAGSGEPWRIWKATNEKAGAKGSGLRILPELGRSSAVTFFYVLVDIVPGGRSHEISNYIAMQQTQFYFAKVSAVLVLLAAAPAAAGTMAKPHQPDPLLDGGPTSPCMAGPDYVAEVDVNGRPVAPADEQARPVPVPDEIAVPLHSGQRAGRRGRSASEQSGGVPYVSLDGRRLVPLLSPRTWR